MRALGAIPAPEWSGDAYTVEQIIAKLELWAEHLLEFRTGATNCCLTLAEILRELDRWLDERLDLRGR